MAITERKPPLPGPLLRGGGEGENSFIGRVTQGGARGSLPLGYILLPLRGVFLGRAEREFSRGCQKEK